MSEHTPGNEFKPDYPPPVIWLQHEGPTYEDWDGVTWCVHQINEMDIEYHRVDASAPDLKRENEELRAQIKQLAEALAGLLALHDDLHLRLDTISAAIYDLEQAIDIENDDTARIF